MRFRLSLSSSIVAFGLLLTIGFVAMVATSLYALRELKVGGPLYTEIKLGNDLVADILPPPEYVIEAYLEATLAMREPDQLAGHSERLIQLRKDYDDRKAFWASSELTGELKSSLVVKSDAEVQKFWNALARLLPALKAGDLKAAELAYGEIKTAYAAHRAVIDSIVEIGRIAEAAARHGVVQPVRLRVNSGVHAHTHEYLATAREDQKFGIALSDAADAVAAIRAQPSLEFLGLHSHIGSQIFGTDGFAEAASRLLELHAELLRGGPIPELNLGGGFGIAYTSVDVALPLEELAAVDLADKTKITAGTYGTGSASNINDLRAFVEALSRTVGHFRGEGECFASAK